MSENNKERCLQEAEIKALRQEIGENRSNNKLLEQSRVTLEKAVGVLEKRLELLELKYETMNEMSTSISIMSLGIDHIIEHNERQDKLQEQMGLTNTSLVQTLDNMNGNINELNQIIKSISTENERLREKLLKLEELVRSNEGKRQAEEDKNKVDLREFERDRQKGILAKNAKPVALGALGTAILAIILELIKRY